LGGEAGARLAQCLAMATSPDTLLRLIRTTNACGPPCPGLRVLGVDDWAWRRGQRYGTILVDLERNAVVDLLPDRHAETLAGWLRQHAGIEVVARDRAGAYAEGIAHGAPQARQVADRWHLLRNLGQAVQALVGRHHGAVSRVAKQVREQGGGSAPLPGPEPARPPTVECRRQAAYARRQARYEEAARLRAAGVSLSGIGRRLGVERKTVRRWLRAGGAPRWAQPSRRGRMLIPWRAYLERRWAEGCRNATQLWRELVGLGFRGDPRPVRAWAAPRRQAESGSRRSRWQPPTGYRLARWLMAEADDLAEVDRTFVTGLLAEAPRLADAIRAAKRLERLLQRQSQEPIGEVLEGFEGTLLTDFGAALRQDLPAVQAALDLPWTTSPVEGQINRLKLIKRAMYGRAGFNLLRSRVLQAA
jgi:transposase